MSQQPPPQSSRRRTKATTPTYEEQPQWFLGNSGGWPEKMAALTLVLVALASIWLEPGFNRPLRHVPVMLAGLAGVQSAYFIARSRIHERTLLTLIPLALWWLWALLSYCTSLDSFRSQQTLVSWTGGAGVFLLASLGFSSGRAWRASLLAITISAALFCAVAVLGKAAQQPLTATFSNRDTFSIIPMVATFLALALARSPGKEQQLLATALALGFALVTLASGSRAGAVGLLVGCAGWLGSLALHRDASLLRRASRLAFRGGVLMLFLGLAGGLIQPLLSRFGEAFNGQDIQGVTMRHDVLVHGLEASRHYPLLGSGPGTFALAYQQFRPQGAVPDYIYVNYAHNDYIEMLVEVGWIGMGAWLIFSFLVLLRGVRLIRYSIASWECSCLLAALVSLGAFAALNFILPVPGVFLWQMLILGLLQGLPTGPHFPSSTAFPQRVLALAICIVGLGCAALSFAQLRAAQLLRQAQELTQALRWEDSVAVLDQALRWQPRHLEALNQRGLSLTRMGQFLNRSDWLKQGEADFDKASRISPRDQDVASNRVLFYCSTKQYAKAEQLLEQAHLFASYREWHLPKITEVRLLQGNLEGAARSIYAVCLDDPKARAALPQVLVSLEEQQAKAATNLLREWSDQEGETGMSLGLAKNCAQLALDSNHVPVAQSFLTFLLEKSPDDSQGQYLLSKVYALQGKQPECTALLTKLSTQASTTKEDPYVDAALVDLAQGQDLRPLSPALRQLEQRLKRFPQSVPLRLVVAQAYLDHGKVDTAAEFVAAGLEASAEDPTLLARMGTCLSRQGLADLARSYYEQALAIAPKNSEARLGLAKLR